MTRIILYILMLSASGAFAASGYRAVKDVRDQRSNRSLQLNAPKELSTSHFFCMLRAQEGFLDGGERSNLEKPDPVRLTEFRRVDIDETNKKIAIAAPLIRKPSAQEQENYEILSINQKRILAASSTVVSADDPMGSPASMQIVIIDRTAGRMVRTSTDAWFTEIFFPKGQLSAYAEFFQCDNEASVKIQ